MKANLNGCRATNRFDLDIYTWCQWLTRVGGEFIRIGDKLWVTKHIHKAPHYEHIEMSFRVKAK